MVPPEANTKKVRDLDKNPNGLIDFPADKSVFYYEIESEGYLKSAKEFRER